MSHVVYTRLTPEQIRGRARLLALALMGRASDASGAAEGIALRAGLAQLAVIQEDFIAKSRGGVGPHDRQSWLPLDPRTIAYERRATRAAFKSAGVTDRGGSRPFLTPAQDKEWRRIFATRKARLMAKFGMGEREASAQAAQIAWATLKAAGAKTKLAALGGRTVQIGVDKGLLLASLSPGTASEHQVLRSEPGAVIVGTNRPGAGRFHKKRPLWPTRNAPPRYYSAALLALCRGLEEAAAQTLGR